MDSEVCRPKADHSFLVLKFQKNLFIWLIGDRYTKAFGLALVVLQLVLGYAMVVLGVVPVHACRPLHTRTNAHLRT